MKGGKWIALWEVVGGIRGFEERNSDSHMSEEKEKWRKERGSKEIDECICHCIISFCCLFVLPIKVTA